MKLTKMIEYIKHDHGRVFVVGDIHGMYDDFMDKLESVGFDYDNDLCLSVGDLVDRGDKSLDCFNLLSKQWFKSVRGNHEQFCIDYFYAISHGVGNELKDSHIQNGGAWFYKLPHDVMKHISDKMNQMPLVLVLERGDKKYMVVHGDIPSNVNDLDSLKHALDNDTRDYTKNTILWGRGVAQNSIRNPTVVPQFNGVEKVYLGHTVMPNVLMNKNYVFLDTGAVFKDSYEWGKLTLLEIV